MGNTTLIELNHDLYSEIEQSPDTFIRIILEQLSSAEHAGKSLPGGRVVAYFHRSGDIEKAWNSFKRKWGSKC